MAHAPSLALALPDAHGLVLALTLALATSPGHEDGVPRPPHALVEQECTLVAVRCHPAPSPTCPPSCTLVPVLALRHALAWPVRPHSPSPHPTCTCAVSFVRRHPTRLPARSRAPSFSLAPLNMRACLALGLYYVMRSARYVVISKMESLQKALFFNITPAYVLCHLL